MAQTINNNSNLAILWALANPLPLLSEPLSLGYYDVVNANSKSVVKKIFGLNITIQALKGELATLASQKKAMAWMVRRLEDLNNQLKQRGIVLPTPDVAILKKSLNNNSLPSILSKLEALRDSLGQLSKDYYTDIKAAQVQQAEMTKDIATTPNELTRAIIEYITQPKSQVAAPKTNSQRQIAHFQGGILQGINVPLTDAMGKSNRLKVEQLHKRNQALNKKHYHLAQQYNHTTNQLLKAVKSLAANMPSDETIMIGQLQQWQESATQAIQRDAYNRQSQMAATLNQDSPTL